jgi:serine/threonine-protein kinase
VNCGHPNGPHEARLDSFRGGVYQNLGKLDRAETLLQLALTERQALAGANLAGQSLDIAQSKVALGLLRVDQAKLDDAENLVRQGLDIFKRDLPSSDASVIRATVALGKVLEARGSYEKAIGVMEESVRLQDKAGAATPELADSLAELANNHFYAGHYDVSDTLNRRVLEMYRRMLDERLRRWRRSIINLGASQLDRGHIRRPNNTIAKPWRFTKSTTDPTIPRPRPA